MLMDVKMVAYEPRAFMHDASPYQAMTDADPDHPTDAEERFGETDVSELAGYHNAQLDEGQILGHHDERTMMEEAAHEPKMDLVPTPTMALSSLQAPEAQAEKSSPIPTSSQAKSDATETGAAVAPTPTRMKLIPKPDREVSKHPDGKFYCAWAGCAEASQGFNRRCEWSKHMDKHERPYRCDHQGCEKLPGFTYSGGLLRHQREVHGKHGGPKNTFNCPHTNCKRHAGKGFSRQENLNEHLRRVHTEGASPSAADEAGGHAPSDTDSEKAATGQNGSVTSKRKRSRGGSADHLIDDDIREEMKRLRSENEHLREQVQQQRQEQINMASQIEELQTALRISNATMASPTSLM